MQSMGRELLRLKFLSFEYSKDDAQRVTEVDLAELKMARRTDPKKRCQRPLKPSTFDQHRHITSSINKRVGGRGEKT